MSTIYSIYKVTNLVNSKIYIGITNNFQSRKNSHLSMTRKNKTNNIFHHALRKYGFDAFQWEIIAESKEKEAIKELEIHFIKYYNSHYITGHGYNMTNGGELTNGPINRKRFGAANSFYGKHHTDEAKRKNSEANKIAQLGAKNAFYGKKHSDETKRIISEKNSISSLKFMWLLQKPDGEILCIRSMAKWCAENNLHSNHMGRVANGHIDNYKGYVAIKL